MDRVRTSWAHLFAGWPFWAMVGVWTGILGMSLLWHHAGSDRLIRGMASEQARATLQRDLHYRRWNADHGGVYVPVTARMQPNPLLTIPDRDVTTTTGRSLTLVNPAFMNRQVYELADGGDPIRSHLTSLRPLRPQNAPDAWEAAALRSFEQGRREAMEMTTIDGAPYLRLMRPFITEARCLKCHGDQGYQIGDIRGGLAIAVPLAPIQALAAGDDRRNRIVHSLIWLLGLAALVGLHLRIAVLDRRRQQMEQEHGEQIDFTQHLIDTIPMPIYSKDVAGRYRHCNAAFLAFLGLPRDQIIGHTVYDIAPRDLADRYTAMDAELLAQGGIQRYEAEARDAQGVRRPVAFTKAVYHRDGQVAGLVGLTLDLSERSASERALRESEDRFRRLFDHNISGVALHEIICDEAGQPRDYRFLDCNPAFETLTGLQRTSIIGRTVLEVLPRTEPEWIMRFGSVALGGMPDCFEQYAASLGRWYGVAAFQTRPGQFAVMFQDISARKEIESALRQAHAQSKEAMQAKNRFLATMSHEIRTPLNGIIGLTSLLRRSHLAKDQVELVDMVHGSGQHLLALINDILDLARMDAGRLELERATIDLRQLTEDLRVTCSATLGAKNLSFAIETDAAFKGRITGDPLRLRQVLINLLSNAIKFTERGGVTLVMRAGDEGTQPRALVIEVRDTGIGIPADYLPHLFEPFTQADLSSTRRFGGSGLGLTVVKRLVDLMGGTIAVDAGNSGTTVRIILPQPDVDDDAAGELEAPVTAAFTGTPPTVLVVEDNPTNLTMTRMMLEEMHLRCRVATDGDQALALVAAEHLDLVLMDCQLPVRDGFSATGVIRQREREQGGTRHLVIIALTASVQPEDRQRCLEAGMDGLLAKPFTFDALRNCLAPWLAKRRH